MQQEFFYGQSFTSKVDLALAAQYWDCLQSQMIPSLQVTLISRATSVCSTEVVIDYKAAICMALLYFIHGGFSRKGQLQPTIEP